jgi:hypothetical protein
MVEIVVFIPEHKTWNAAMRAASNYFLPDALPPGLGCGA